MSGLTSTINDSGRVYLFDRNALPKNFIESGMKMTPSGLAVNIAPGSCDISGKYHELTEQVSLTLPQRRACMPYALKSDLADEPTFGYVQAAFPAADAGTVCRWIIDGSADIASTVGSNNLTKTGTVTQVDGWIGYGGKGDGSTGYYASANSTGFPSGAAAFEVDLVITAIPTSAIQAFTQDGNYAMGVFINASNNLNILDDSSGLVDTGYPLETGKTYYIGRQYDGLNDIVFVNGQCVYKVPRSRTATAGVLYVLRNSTAAYYSSSILHYVEVRNALRTPAQIAAISNALLLPCRYENDLTELTTTDGNLITNGDYSGYPKANAVDGSISTAWYSAANGTADVTYIGRTGLSTPVGKVRIYSSSSTSNNMSTVKPQYSLDGGSTWKTIDTITIPITVSAWVDIPMPTYACGSGYQFRLLAGASLPGNCIVQEIKFYSGTASTLDIRSLLPADAISLGFVRTGTSAVVELDDWSYKTGRREGATGGNRRAFLGWKYFSGVATLAWDNPFGTRKIKTIYVWAQDASGTNESDITFDSASTSTFSYVPQGTSAQRIRASFGGGLGVTILNGGWQTSGYIGCYAEVIE